MLVLIIFFFSLLFLSLPFIACDPHPHPFHLPRVNHIDDLVGLAHSFQLSRTLRVCSCTPCLYCERLPASCPWPFPLIIDCLVFRLSHRAIMFSVPSGPAIRTAVLYGLLAVPCLHVPSAEAVAVAPLHHRAPQITEAPSATAAQAPAITAVSKCHPHGDELFCQVGTAEYRVSGSATASSYTDCHVVNGETYVLLPRTSSHSWLGS